MTIYDIAKAANVSASTVSRIINNKGGVKESTRKKVEALLREHHYLPNEAARGLVNQSSMLIGILISDIRTAHHADGVYYIVRELAELGYCCIIMNTGSDDASKTEYLRTLKMRRAEGVILIGSAFQTDVVKKAIVEYLPTIPIVIANGYLDLPNVYGVIADEQNGVTSCIQMLVEKGHKNPAFVIDEYTPSNHLKQLGFELGVRQWCPYQKKPIIVQSTNTINGAYQATRTLMEKNPEVDSIVYAVDLLAAGGIRALLEMGYNIPEDVSVVGVDNSIYTEICNPRLTSLDNKLFDLSVTAARTLIDVLQERRVNKRIMIMSTIVERETT